MSAIATGRGELSPFYQVCWLGLAMVLVDLPVMDGRLGARIEVTLGVALAGGLLVAAVALGALAHRLAPPRAAAELPGGLP